jgi:hypothetical protein
MCACVCVCVCVCVCCRAHFCLFRECSSNFVATHRKTHGTRNTQDPPFVCSFLCCCSQHSHVFKERKKRDEERKAQMKQRQQQRQDRKRGGDADEGANEEDQPAVPL